MYVNKILTLSDIQISVDWLIQSFNKVFKQKKKIKKNMIKKKTIKCS